MSPDEILQRLLDRANSDPGGQLWTSVSDVLPLLAEAAPEHWPELIARIPDMPASKRAEVYRRLQELADA
jgi:hypothetical protein